MRSPIVWYRTGEASLALTVIGCAIYDYAQHRGDDYHSAHMFLFSEYKNWRNHRQLICDIAGVSVEFVQRMALRANERRGKMTDEKKTMVDLGCCNGWSSRPNILDECQKKQHVTESVELGRCYYRVTCKECGYTYTIDSSD